MVARTCIHQGEYPCPQCRREEEQLRFQLTDNDPRRWWYLTPEVVLLGDLPEREPDVYDRARQMFPSGLPKRRVELLLDCMHRVMERRLARTFVVGFACGTAIATLVCVGLHVGRWL